MRASRISSPSRSSSSSSAPASSSLGGWAACVCVGEGGGGGVGGGGGGVDRWLGGGRAAPRARVLHAPPPRTHAHTHTRARTPALLRLHPRLVARVHLHQPVALFKLVLHKLMMRWGARLVCVRRGELDNGGGTCAHATTHERTRTRLCGDAVPARLLGQPREQVGDDRHRALLLLCARRVLLLLHLLPRVDVWVCAVCVCVGGVAGWGGGAAAQGGRAHRR